MKKISQFLFTNLGLILIVVTMTILIVLSPNKQNKGQEQPLKSHETPLKTAQCGFIGASIPTINRELKIVETAIIPAGTNNQNVIITRTTHKGKSEIALSTPYFNLKANHPYPSYQNNNGEVMVFIEANNFPYAKIMRLKGIVFR